MELAVALALFIFVGSVGYVYFAAPAPAIKKESPIVQQQAPSEIRTEEKEEEKIATSPPSLTKAPSEKKEAVEKPTAAPSLNPPTSTKSQIVPLPLPLSPLPTPSPSAIYPTPIKVDLKIDGSDGPIAVMPDTSHTISWTTSGNPAWCGATGNWLGAKNPGGGSEIITIPSDVWGFYLTCMGINDSVVVTISDSEPLTTGPKVLAPKPAVIFDGGSLHNSANAPNVQKIAQKFYQKYSDDYDFLLIFTTIPSDQLLNAGFHHPVKKDVQGIGKVIQNYTADYGSSRGRLLAINFDGPVDIIVNSKSYQLTSNTIDIANGSVYHGIFHEIAHQWAVGIGCASNKTCRLPVQQPNNYGHWDLGLYSPYGETILEANNKWIDNGDGSFTRTPLCPVNYFPRLHPLDFYLMGLKDENEIPDTFFVVKPENGYNDFYFFCDKPTTVKGTKISFGVKDIIEEYGARIPNKINSQKDFSLAIILVESANYPATQEMKDALAIIANNTPAIWNWLTEGRSTIKFP